MTLKDQFDIKGLDTTLGYVGKAFQPAQEDAVFVTILKKMGALVLAKTNLPQSIMVRSWYSGFRFLVSSDSSRSGAKLTTHYGVELIILLESTSLRAVLVAEKVLCLI